VLEGGYDLDALEQSLGAALAGLLVAQPAPPSLSPATDATHAVELDHALASARAFWHL